MRKPTHSAYMHDGEGKLLVVGWGKDATEARGNARQKFLRAYGRGSRRCYKSPISWINYEWHKGRWVPEGNPMIH
jgi:hypothetical protein